MSKQFVVKLDGCASFTSPKQGGKIPWRRGQERVFLESDPRLAYYQGQRVFRVFEKLDAAAPLLKRKPKKQKETKPSVEPAPDRGAEDARPLADSAPEPSSDLPSDSELQGWLKADLLKLAQAHGLEVTEKNTKGEIRAELDKIR